MLRNYTKVIQQPQGGEDQSPLNRTFTYIMFTHHKYLIYDSLSVLCPLVIIAGCGPRSCAHKRGHAGDVEVHKNTGHVPAISKKGPIKICVFNLNWWIFPLLLGELLPQPTFDHKNDTRNLPRPWEVRRRFQRPSDDITGPLQGLRKRWHPGGGRRPDGSVDRTAALKLNGLG